MHVNVWCIYWMFLGSYGNYRPYYSVNCIIAISDKDDTFLDIRPLQFDKWCKVLIKRGDLFCFRGDVAHRGVHNTYPYDHYRLHCYCDIASEPRKKHKTYYVGCPFSKQIEYCLDSI